MFAESLELACWVNGVAAARRLAELRMLFCFGRGTNRRAGTLQELCDNFLSVIHGVVYPRRHLRTLLSEANGLKGQTHTLGGCARAHRRLRANGDDETCLYTVGTL